MMERYINQLIEEFHSARTKVKPPLDIWDGIDLDDPGEVEDINYAEQFI